MKPIVSREFGLASAAQMWEGSKLGMTIAPAPPRTLDLMKMRRLFFLIINSLRLFESEIMEPRQKNSGSQIRLTAGE
jgi:hypothetical protein